MLKQLLDHCSKFNLLPEFQSAYRQNNTMVTSLLKMVNDKLCGMENQEITRVVILVLSAAFDTADHDIFPHWAQESLWYIWRGDKMV